MNTYQLVLFNELEELIQGGDVFYRQEYELDGSRYWIYNYRLASYTEFLKPSALECRGIMFEVDNDNIPIRLASLPMQKFFNLNENPLTIGLDLATVVSIEDKADGSLMSTYLHNGELRLKSKGSLFSDHAIDAMKWLDREENFVFRQMLLATTMSGWTVNLEWCSSRPEHRIVIGHPVSHLVVLNARLRATGEYGPYRLLKDTFKEVNVISRWYPTDKESFINSIPDMTENIEGYVVTLENGLSFKCKTNKYLTAHRAKDSINSDRRLFEAVIDEAIDDVRSLFHHDELVMSRINAMEEKVGNLYNSVVKTVETFYEENKSLIRKDYAIKGQAELGLYFGLGMNKYIGKETNYKEFIKKQWKELGIKDEEDMS